ncbi:glycosyltransferase [Gilvibacter sediminis]|uniref:glycosyltransferase n=1 Tax=Gilvibacter sediminis TaxID=379071 RepID=UPI00235052E1|nr:glycosyltransferase [Gilvibacter sediminis]MDC7999248.1 glycosyltransferase [Gilvibacter sediminis]
MKLLVVSAAPILKKKDVLVAYAPMVAELDLWFEKADEVTILAPTKYPKQLLTKAFARQDIKIVSVPALYFGSFSGLLNAVWGIPVTKIKLLIAMAKADHIHLRPPGTISLFGCWMQILFPWKKKTAKYAGNWSPKAAQPFSYRVQKRLLSNTFLTRNMQVLVYGDWPDQTKNIKPFFTATYWESEKQEVAPRDYSGAVKMVYLGTLSPNKRVDYAVKLIRELKDLGVDANLDVYGEGAERPKLERQISALELGDRVILKGNQPAEVVREALKKAHFSILASQSEGWPKAVAEAMFWGAIPLASPVSCVPWMLDQGKRGLLLDFETDAETIAAMLTRPRRLSNMASAAVKWSQQYTMDRFRSEIHKLLES